MIRVHLLIMAEACRVIEPRIRVMMLNITHMIGVPRTKCNLGIIMHNRDIGSLSLVGTGRTLTRRSSSSWSKYLPLMEFAYNNSYQATIGVAPYEMLYGRKCM